MYNMIHESYVSYVSIWVLSRADVQELISNIYASGRVGFASIASGTVKSPAGYPMIRVWQGSWTRSYASGRAGHVAWTRTKTRPPGRC